MIDAYDEILDVVFDEIDDRLQATDNVSLGAISSNYSGGRPSVVFDGESQPSVKRYPYLSSYQPRAGDRVMLLRGVIVGKIV